MERFLLPARKVQTGAATTKKATNSSAGTLSNGKKAAEAEDIEDIWKVHLDRIRTMRSVTEAPVDTQGCHKLADPLAEPKVYRFQILVSLMLSSQTKDQTNGMVMKKLKDRGLTIENILKMDDGELEKLLYPVSFYKRKVIYLKKVAAILKKEYGGDIPDTVKGLTNLPGVGPKMAHLCVQCAWNKVEGIGVDVHVHRIVNRLGWVKTKTAEATRMALEKILPREEWQAFNPLMVGFGQSICRPVGPKCSECLCRDTCPAANVKPKKAKGKRVRKAVVEEDTEEEESPEESSEEEDSSAEEDE